MKDTSLLQSVFVIISVSLISLRHYLWFSQDWFPTVQDVLHADWQDVWHSPQPPFFMDSFRVLVVNVFTLFIVLSSSSKPNLKYYSTESSIRKGLFSFFSSYLITVQLCRTVSVSSQRIRILFGIFRKKVISWLLFPKANLLSLHFPC